MKLNVLQSSNANEEKTKERRVRKMKRENRKKKGEEKSQK